MTRRRAGDLAANYRLTVTQEKVDDLHVHVELTADPRKRTVQWFVEPSPHGGTFQVKPGRGPKYGPISVHKTYEQACTRAHRNARTWLHSALGTGTKAPRRLP